MKHRLLIFVLFLSLLSSSCQYDPYYLEEYYVENGMTYSIMIYGNVKGIPDTITIQPNAQKLIKHWNENTYGDAGDIIPIWANDNETIVFNDSLTLSFGNANSSCFNKSFWRKNSWEQIYYNGKKRSTHYKLLYTIDEEDYHNALVQCGYEQQTD